MKAHTEEPWEAFSECPGECCWHIRQVGTDSPFDQISNPELSEEDAKRIVACVNACKGIPTETLVEEGLPPTFNITNYQNPADENLAITPPTSNLIPLDDTVRSILGRPSFSLTLIAARLRHLGHDIKRKAEDEQAVVLHWMLNLYQQHGEEWQQKGEEYLASYFQNKESTE